PQWSRKPRQYAGPRWKQRFTSPLINQPGRGWSRPGREKVMRKQQIESAAYDVATQVRTVEESIETALAEIADLQSKMVHARAVTRAGFITSHPAFEQLAATVSSPVAARGGTAQRPPPAPHH